LVEFASYLPGTPSWIELATTDVAAAASFYQRLFGWAVEPAGEGARGHRNRFLLRGKPVAGAHQLGSELIRDGIQPHWISYVTVGSVDETVASVVASGGTIVHGPGDVADSGRMAVIQDPTAAILALWEPRTHHGAALANETGALVWNELQTYDTASASKFYQAVFGWRSTTGRAAGNEYTSFMVDEHPVAGMLAIQPEWGAVPPNWSIYLGVDDVAAACTLAVSLGGKVEVQPSEIPNVGWFALLRDPQGSYFYVIR